MDNVTHSIAGLLIAEGILQLRGRRGTVGDTFRRSVFGASLVANNFPDLDFLYTGITGGKLGYLLHHRGHTHTIAAALPIGLLVYAAARFVASARGRTLSRADRGWLAAVSLAGPLVHLLMDYQNNYGIHPFWPVDDTWRYGDSVFIVEPLFWAAAMPPLFFAVRSRIAKAALGVILAAGLVLTWAVPFVPAPCAAAVTLLAAVTAAVAWRASGSARVIVAAGIWLGVVGVFVVAGHRVRSLARQAASQVSGMAIDDVVSTAMPANPICWNVIVVRSDGQRFSLMRAGGSVAPALFSATDCAMAGRPTAPLEPVSATSTARIAWQGQFEAPVGQLRTLAKRDCRAAAFLRFARAPFFEQRRAGLVIGDLRFDRDSDIGFAEMRLTPLEDATACPAFVPPWVPPREDLLR